jgi:hypothetical protein
MPLTTTRNTIVAYTAEDDRLVAVRREAERLARDHAATLILYDIDAAEPLAGSPLPTNWSADRTDEQTPDRLDADDLERAGRHPIAEQVRFARSKGIDAWGWLPPDPRGSALRDYAEQVGAGIVLLPEELTSPDLLERIEGKTAGDAMKNAPSEVEIRVVGS